MDLGIYCMAVGFLSFVIEPVNLGRETCSCNTCSCNTAKLKLKKKGGPLSGKVVPTVTCSTINALTHSLTHPLTGAEPAHGV